jgi:hypothetical protein
MVPWPIPFFESPYTIDFRVTCNFEHPFRLGFFQYLEAGHERYQTVGDGSRKGYADMGDPIVVFPPSGSGN